MQIFVKSVSGTSLTLNVASDASVDSVKHMIENDTFISGFRLVCGGKQVEVRRICIAFACKSFSHKMSEHSLVYWLTTESKTLIP